MDYTKNVYGNHSNGRKNTKTYICNFQTVYEYRKFSKRAQKKNTGNRNNKGRVESNSKNRLGLIFMLGKCSV